MLPLFLSLPPQTVQFFLQLPIFFVWLPATLTLIHTSYLWLSLWFIINSINLKILGRLYDIAAHLTQEQRPTILDAMNRAVARTLVIVSDTHKHIDRVLCTYMTSYLPQPYRLSILIDKKALFINSWLIRLSVDNFLLISTRRLSILIDKPIPLSTGVSKACRSLRFSF